MTRTLPRLAASLPAPADPRTDAELLAAFRVTHDAAAFAVLVHRHAAGVRGVCRGRLRNPADVDDAAQATFLVLATRAAKIRNPAALGPWLYGVAENVSRRLAAKNFRHRPLPVELPAPEPVAIDDRADAVMAEVLRLPEKYRRPVQLCYAGGLTTAAAAELLGWPRGTVLTRLARAKAMLHRRLAGKVGLAFAGATAGRASAAWVTQTARAAAAIAAGAKDVLVPERIMSLTEGVAKTMTGNTLKIAAVVAVLATAVGGFVAGPWAAADNNPKQKTTAPDAPATKVEPAKPDDAKPGGRRQAVIRMPVGTFVKDVEVGEYGSGRIAWTYDEDRVTGKIEVAGFGGEIELATDAEISMSSSGTIYGVVTGFKLKITKLPQGKDVEGIAQYAQMWPLIEPFVSEMLTDLPFSYQVRLTADRLVIQNYRALLAGPNPAAKFGLLDGEPAKLMAGFAIFGAAIEGTYLLADGKEKEAPKAKSMFKKPVK